METNKAAKKAQTKETEFQILQDRLEEMENQLLEISEKTNPVVTWGVFCIRDEKTNSEMTVSRSDMKFIPTVGQTFAFDLTKIETEVPILPGESKAAFKERHKLLKEQYSGKPLCVTDTRFDFIYCEVCEQPEVLCFIDLSSGKK